MLDQLSRRYLDLCNVLQRQLEYYQWFSPYAKAYRLQKAADDIVAITDQMVMQIKAAGRETVLITELGKRAEDPINNFSRICEILVDVYTIVRDTSLTDERWEAALAVLTEPQRLIAQKIRSKPFGVSDDGLTEFVDGDSKSPREAVAKQIRGPRAINGRWKREGVPFRIKRTSSRPTLNQLIDLDRAVSESGQNGVACK